MRFARNCSTNDLWKTYFTSSRHVKEFREQYGEPDVIQVRQTFNDSLQAREWEHKVLRRLKVLASEKWLNKSTGKSIPPLIGSDHPFFGKTHSDDVRKKMSRAKKGIVFSVEHREKLSRGNKGKIVSDATKAKMSLAKKGKIVSDATKAKIALALKGKIVSDETKKKMSKLRKGITTVFDIEENKNVKIDVKLYQQNRERYLHTNSKAYKEIKEGEK